MNRVLIIDDDKSTLETFSLILRRRGFDVHVAESGRSGLTVAVEHDFDVILSDLLLPDISGLTILEKLKAAKDHVRFVLMTGFGSTRSVIEAMHLGVADYVEKPIFEDELVQIIDRALTDTLPLPPPLNISDVRAHSSERLARVIITAIDAPSDPKTLRIWGRQVAAATGTLKNWCRTANVSARRVLIFARVLRAVVLYREKGYPLEESLDVVDRRSIIKLLQATGIPDRDRMPLSIDDFIANQTLISDPTMLRELKRGLIGRGVSGQKRNTG